MTRNIQNPGFSIIHAQLEQIATDDLNLFLFIFLIAL